MPILVDDVHYLLYWSANLLGWVFVLVLQMSIKGALHVLKVPPSVVVLPDLLILAALLQDTIILLPGQPIGDQGLNLRGLFLFLALNFLNPLPEPKQI